MLKYFTTKNYFECKVSITLLTLNGRLGNVKLSSLGPGRLILPHQKEFLHMKKLHMRDFSDVL